MNIEVKGLDATLKKFERLASQSKGDIQGALNDFADRTASDAKRLAPADEGKLRQSISPVYGDLQGGVVANINYAAYQEFGTRKFAAQYVSGLHEEWQRFAAKFKGANTRPGGNGCRPQPFIYPSINKNIPLLKQDIRAIFK